MEAEISSKGSTQSADGQLLVLVLDVNTDQKAFFGQPEDRLNKWVDAAITFVNAHLMLHANNSLAIIGAARDQCTFLYPQPCEENEVVRFTSTCPDGQFEGFYLVEKTVRSKLEELLAKELASNSPPGSCESLVAGGLCMALAYIQRCERELSKHKGGPDSLSLKRKAQSSRILVMTASGTTASHYMSYMNVFFTAQKLNILIDACILDRDSGLLQQGADMTNGKYIRVKKLESLLQFLLWAFLPDTSLRGGQLSLPIATKVDYRAACFCHRQLVDIGFVCSVCLSIFCKFSPMCSTCQTVFKIPGALPTLVGKRKKGLVVNNATK